MLCSYCARTTYIGEPQLYLYTILLTIDLFCLYLFVFTIHSCSPISFLECLYSLTVCVNILMITVDSFPDRTSDSQISFQCILTQMYWNLISILSPGFVPLGANLTQFGPKSDTPEWDTVLSQLWPRSSNLSATIPSRQITLWKWAISDKNSLHFPH